jgi:hypothetical protein
MSESDPIFEERVRYWVRLMEQGKPVPMPVLVRPAGGGKAVPLRDDDRAKLEALKRTGDDDETVEAYVIDEKDVTPEQLEQLRKELDRAATESN